ncbi:MAG TPA: cytochrome c oxidase subunit II transmembrane domain-containing protein [Candidatus Sulfopaludibacter sp.]|jgi:cytochrome c oxidase subunit 2|nr:cytochrome c oxidase subunit II transmembrane domain-containing protein [Candidatus Sulfopaludibacter sp.]
MLLAPVVWALTVVICYFFIAKTWWFPPAISQHGLAYDGQFMRTLIVVGIIFFLAQFVLGYVIVRFRDDGGRASYSHGNNKLETIWTSATALLFLGLVIMGTKIWAGVHFDEAPPDSIAVEVMAKQFAWSFRYPGADGKFGHTDLKLVNDANGNPMGIDDKDPASKDDIVSASLKVPVGRSIKLILHSRDVIHNFFVRELRMKQDIVPGMEIPLHFQADQIGIYEVPCSELCGLGHYQMRTTMQVMSQADFDKWMQQQLQNK